MGARNERRNFSGFKYGNFPNNNIVMFKGSMYKLLAATWIFLLVACSPGHETPARAFELPAEHLSVDQVVEYAIRVGAENGLTHRINDPEVLATINDGVPTAFIWLSKGNRTAATVTTVKNNGMVQVWLYESGLGSEESLDKLENDFHEAYSRE
jgi:hypothetical protein